MERARPQQGLQKRSRHRREEPVLRRPHRRTPISSYPKSLAQTLSLTGRLTICSPVSSAPPPNPEKPTAAQSNAATSNGRAAASPSPAASPVKARRTAATTSESKHSAQQPASHPQANGKSPRGGRARRHSPPPPGVAASAPAFAEHVSTATAVQHERPHEEIPETSAPKKGATATALTKAIKAAMSSLSHGLVSAAYSELRKAISPDAPDPDGTFEEDLESVSILVAESFRAAKKSEAKEVLQKLDEAETLWPKTTAPLPKGVDTTAAVLRVKCMRLHAHAGLDDYEKVVEMSECVAALPGSCRVGTEVSFLALQAFTRAAHHQDVGALCPHERRVGNRAIRQGGPSCPFPRPHDRSRRPSQ